MAIMQALLKIRADVQGEGQVNALGRAIGGVQARTAAATGALRGMTAAAGMGGLAGAMGALTPLLSVAGLVTMAKSSLEAGDAIYDMSQRTGISVESLAKFKKAASTTGTDLESVAKASMKLSKGLMEAAESGKGPAAEALQSLGIIATDASGKVRSADSVMLDIASKFKAMPDGVEKTAIAIQLFGRSGAEMIPMLNMGGDAIDKLKVKMTEAFAKRADQYSDKLKTLSGKVGALGMDIIVALLPALESITNALTVGVDAFNKLDPSLRNLIVLGATIAIAWGPLTALFTGLMGIFSGIGTALAAIGPMVAGITAALGGLLAWITGTLIPGLLAVFSGPVGWTILAVAAVVAMCIAFREPIMNFFSWLGDTIGNGLNALWEWGEPIRNFWEGVWDSVKNLASNAFDGIVNGVKAAFRAVLQNIANQINGAASLVNKLISAFNRLPAPDIPLIPTLTVPAFAEGGVVTSPTLAMVGEGGEPEYIIPQSKMAAASANYLAGARGAGIMNGSGGATRINITTGPVLEFNGERYVTLADMERGLQQMAGSVMNGLRTPAGRYAVGVR